MNRRSRPELDSAAVRPLPDARLAAQLDIVCDDAPVLAVNKPAGMLSQGAPQGAFALPDYVKAYLKQTYEKPGNVYLGVIHRLDRPVTGVVVFSRNSKGAARLSTQFRERTVRKCYLAVLEQPPPQPEGELTDNVRKIPDQARAEIVPASTADGKPARLSYRVLATSGAQTLVEVIPITGRMHQIRLQFAHRGCPVLGDQLYGGQFDLQGRPLRTNYTERIALHAARLHIQHPVRYDPLIITADIPVDWPEFAKAVPVPPDESP